MAEINLIGHMGAPSPPIDWQVEVRKQLYCSYYSQKDNEKEKCSHRGKKDFSQLDLLKANLLASVDKGSWPNFSFLTVFEKGANQTPFQQEEEATGESLEMGSVGLCLELGPK